MNGKQGNQVNQYEILKSKMTTTPHNYTRNILLQMLLVVALLAIAAVWQRDVISQIYVENQVNAVGWFVNGGILLLFICGLLQLIKRFIEYRNQEQAINRFKVNVNNNEEPLMGIRQDYMVAERFLVLKSLNKKRASINQNALAATLLASESSRNSFLKFVHNVLILTGVFGTIISLSISLLGASDILQSGGQISNYADGASQSHSAGLGTMIFGMSTALSTTLTAIIAYLFFGYFYIKLTDTQTFLISKIEEVTSTTLMPHLQLDQEAVARDYSESIQSANELIKRLDQSQQIYSDSAYSLEQATNRLSEQILPVSPDQDNQEMLSLVRELIQLQQQTANRNAENMNEVVGLLQRGFRIRSDSRED